MKRAGPWLSVALAVGAVLYAWRFADPVPALNDERAYALQAEIFASFRWTADPAPLPHFFEQLYAFSTPFTAGKYWPGHPLVLSPGWMVGWPPLVPLVLAALTGFLMFAIVTREHGARLALLACLLWSTDASTLVFRASFLSHVTTTACLLTAVWCLQRYLGEPRRTWLALGTAALCWELVTRPLTGAAHLALWIGFFAVRSTNRRRDLAAMLPPFAILCIVPLWNHATTGDWMRTPYTMYTREYFPFDKVGFGFDATPPERQLPPDFAEYGRQLGEYFHDHTIAHLPRLVWERSWSIATLLGREWPIPSWPFVLVGLWAGWRRSAALRWSVWGGVAVFVAHLAFAHPAWWIAYYSEGFVAWFWLAALGMKTALDGVIRVGMFEARAARAATAVGAGLVVLFTVDSLRSARAERAAWERQPRMVERAIAQVEKPAILFVGYGAGANSAFKVTRAEADWPTAHVWVVYDRGERNSDLRAVDPRRTAYVLRIPSEVLHRVP